MRAVAKLLPHRKIIGSSKVEQQDYFSVSAEALRQPFCDGYHKARWAKAHLLSQEKSSRMIGTIGR